MLRENLKDFFHFQLELYKALWFITCLFSLWAHWRGGQRVLLLLVFIYNICYWMDELATDCRTTREFLAQWCVWSTYVDTSRFRSRTAFSLRRGHIWRNNVIEVAHWDSLLFLLQSSEPVRREKIRREKCIKYEKSEWNFMHEKTPHPMNSHAGLCVHIYMHKNLYFFSCVLTQFPKVINKTPPPFFREMRACIFFMFPDPFQ